MEYMDEQTMLQTNQMAWDHVASQSFRGTALPFYGPLAPTEEELHLLGDLRGKRILEIGCGTGESLLYLAERGATELWGIDLSQAQLRHAAGKLQEKGYASHLFHSPMEENPGLPEVYFDFVCSIYALGWTVDLSRTLSLISSYLRDGGIFLFSWEHPVCSCLGYQDGQIMLERSYHNEEPYVSERLGGVSMVRHPRKISTFVNALTNAGFVVEQMVETDVSTERVREAQLSPERRYSIPRAQLMPTTVIFKARKPRTQASL